MIYFKELAHTIEEASKSKIYGIGQQSNDFKKN